MSGAVPPRPLTPPPPPSRRSWFTRRRIVLISVAGGATTAMFAWMVFVPSAPKSEPVKPTGHASRITYDPPLKPTPVVAKVPPPPPAIGSFVQTSPPQPPAPPVPPTPPAAAPVKAPRPAVYTFGGNGAQIPAYMKPASPSEGGGKPPVASTGIAYKSAAIPGAKTMTIPDPNLLLMPGPIICVLDTAVNTDIAGPFQCHLPHAVLSPTNVTLMEQGTTVLGSYASSVSQGQSRIVGVTAFARTPNNVMVPLGGPIADELGAGGVEGNVDNHWMPRLGGALILSMVDSAFSLAQTEMQKSGSTNLNISSGGGVSTLASQLLAKTINIPPTITIPQGTTIALWNLSVIDFSGSYRLEIAK